MNVKKTIKKIVAIGAGAALVGATILGAVASLDNYPGNMVTEGMFNGKIVVGANAATQDVVGAIDIAASLQAAAVTEVAVGDTEETVTVEDGYEFTGATELIYGNSLNDVTATLDDGDLPIVLAGGTLEDNDGSNIDYEVILRTYNGIVKANVDHDLDDTYEEPQLYYEFDATTDFYYTIEVDFDEAVDFTDYADSETIELFGKAFTIQQDYADGESELVWYGSDATMYIAQGEIAEVTYEGNTYEISVVGGNTANSQAILKVGSTTKTVEAGDSRTIGGVPLYIEDVFVSDIGTDEVSVSLFVGSNEYTLKTADELKINDVDIDEVAITAEGTAWNATTKITFTVSPASADVEIEYLASGAEYVDPAFGAFKYYFVGSEDLTADKGLIDFERSGKKGNINFATRGAEEYALTIFDNNDFETDFWTGINFSELTEDKIFIYTEDASTEKEATTHVLQVKNIKDGADPTSSDFEVVVKDLTFDKEYTVTSNDKALSSKIGLYARAGALNTTIDFAIADADTPADYIPVIYTEEGAKIEFMNNGSGIFTALNGTSTENSSIANVSATIGRFTVDEDVDDDEDTATPTSLVFQYAWDSSDNQYDWTYVSGGTNIGDDDDNNDYYMTDFGSYAMVETDDSGKEAIMYVPDEEVRYQMFIMPQASAVTITAGNTGTGAYTVNDIGVGLAVLDTAFNAWDSSAIVVGGPCANSVASALLDNPVECAAGFVEGKGLIKLFEQDDKVSILVAGYNADDTQFATAVLTDYDNYDFMGLDEVETGTALQEVTEVTVIEPVVPVVPVDNGTGNLTE